MLVKLVLTCKVHHLSDVHALLYSRSVQFGFLNTRYSEKFCFPRKAGFSRSWRMHSLGSRCHSSTSSCCGLSTLSPVTRNDEHVQLGPCGWCFKVRSGPGPEPFWARTTDQTSPRKLQKSRTADQTHKKPVQTGRNRFCNKYIKMRHIPAESGLGV